MAANGEQYTFEIDNTKKIVRYTREEAPAHYRLEISSLELFLSAFSLKQLDIRSTIFIAEGCTWYLRISTDDEEKHLSLSLVLVEPRDRFPIKAICKFFIYDHIRKMYLIVQGLEAQRFDDAAREQGISRVLSLDDFRNASNGFFPNSSCKFGVEIAVLGTTADNAILRNVEDFVQDNCKITWPIKNFSECLKHDYVLNDQADMGGLSWTLQMYPKGHGKEWGKSFALFLHLMNYSNLTDGRKLFVNAEIRLKNLNNEPDITKTLITCYDKSCTSWGVLDLIPLRDLHNPDKGFKIGDELIVEVELKHIYMMTDLSTVERLICEKFDLT